MQGNDIYFEGYITAVVLTTDVKCNSELWISLYIYTIFRQ